MTDLLDMHPNNKCLIMYSELERFLTAIFKVPQRMEFITSRANELCVDEIKQYGKLQVNPKTLEYKNRAALVWVLHMKKFRQLIDAYGKEKVQTLESEEFMKNKIKSVLSYLAFIGLDTTDARLNEAILKKTETHAKDNKQIYTYEQREQDYQVKRNLYSEEIDSAVLWAKNTFGKDLVSGL